MLRITRTLEYPADEVWNVLIDTEAWPAWGPSVTAVRAPNRYLRGGDRGHIRTVLGAWLPFEVSEFDRGHYWRWRVAGIPATGHRVEELTEAQCRLVFEVPVLAAPYAAVCALATRRIERVTSARARGAAPLP